VPRVSAHELLTECDCIVPSALPTLSALPVESALPTVSACPTVSAPPTELALPQVSELPLDHIEELLSLLPVLSEEPVPVLVPVVLESDVPLLVDDPVEVDALAPLLSVVLDEEPVLDEVESLPPTPALTLASLLARHRRRPRRIPAIQCREVSNYSSRTG
jgi:hypothetical protein